MKRSPLTVTVLTDTHLYSLKNGFEGKAYDRANSKSQILLAESGEVLDAAFAQISADKRSDIVLICGDLTSNGDLESHKEMIAKLRRLKESGKRCDNRHSRFQKERGYVGLQRRRKNRSAHRYPRYAL